MIRPGGFTLWELLITLCIAGVVAGIGAPALTDLVRDSRRAREVNSFVHSMHLARSEAIKRGRVVTLCKTANGTQCAEGDTRWSDGWLVFVNLDQDTPPRVDLQEPVLYVKPPLKELEIRGNRNAFTFRPFGRRATNGTLVFCDARGAPKARAVIVSVTGRPRMARRTASGAALACP